MCFTLIFQLSGVSAAWAAAPQAALKARIEALQTEGSALSDELAALGMRLRNPNTLAAGRADPAADSRKLEDLERRFQPWKRRLEAVLAANDPATAGAEPKAITFYFQQAVKLVQARALLRKSSGDASIPFSNYDLAIPYRLFERLSGYEGGATSKLIVAALSDPRAMIALDPRSAEVPAGREDLAPEHLVRLQIGRVFASRFVAASKASLSDERAFIDLVKFFATGALLDQWSQIEDLRARPQGRLPFISQELMKEQGGLGRPDLDRAQAETLSREQLFRAGLVEGANAWTSPGVSGEVAPNRLKTLTREQTRELKSVAAASRSLGLELTSQAFLDGYLTAVFGAVPSTEQGKATAREALERMRLSEAAFTQAGLQRALALYPLPLAEMPVTRQRAALRNILGQAKYVSILPVLALIPPPPGRDGAVNTYLTGALARFTAAVPERTLEQWRLSQAESAAQTAQKERKKFIEQLLKDSRVLAKGSEEESLLGTQVDFATLKAAGRNSAPYKALRESTRSDLDLVLKTEEWKTGILGYRMLMKKLAERQAQARQAKDTWKADHFAAEAKELQGVAQFFGFWEGILEPTQLRVVDLWPGPKEAYLAQREAQRLNRSLLTLELDKQPLFKKLAVAQGDAQAEAILESGLAALQSNIQKQLNLLGDLSRLAPAKQIERLLPLIARSGLLRLQISQTMPMLEDQLDDAIDSLVSGVEVRSVGESFRHAAMSPMGVFMYIFFTKLSLLAFRQTRPLVRAVNALDMGVNARLGGYMLATLPVFVADVGLGAAEAYDAHKDGAAARDWFWTSAEETSFYDYFTLADAQSRESAALWQAGSSAFQLALMGGAMGWGLVSPSITRVADRAKLRALDRLGFASPEERVAPEGRAPFTWNVSEIRARAQTQLEQLRKREPDTWSRRLKELRLSSDARSLVKFIENQEKTARKMLQDFAPEFRALGIPAGKESLSLSRLADAKSIMEARYANYVIGRDELVRAHRAFEEITFAINGVWGGSVGPIHALFNKGRKGPLGKYEAFRERLYVEVYGFADLNASANEFRLGPAGEVKDFYATLGVQRGTQDQEAIKKAYRQLALQYHPDRTAGDKVAEQKFTEIAEAYGVLADAKKKARYDSAFEAWLELRKSGMR